MDRQPAWRSSVVTKQNEPPARVRRHGGNRLNPDRLGAELVFPPVQPFVGTEENVIGRVLVVGHDQNGSRISELEEMGILMDFLPSKPSITTQESVTVRVSCQSFSNVSNTHDQARDRWSTERGSRVETFRVSVKVKGTFLKESVRDGWTTAIIVAHRCIAIIFVTLRVHLRRRDYLPGSTYQENVSSPVRGVTTSQTIVMTNK